METALCSNALSQAPARVKASIHLTEFCRTRVRYRALDSTLTKEYINRMSLLRLQHHRRICEHRSDIPDS